jgi:hypothetical protein
MSDCTSCTKLVPLTKDEGTCRKVRERITDVRIGCCAGIIETIASSSLCTIGYIDDVVAEDPVNNPLPLFAVDIYNKEDIDELLDYSFDRATEVGTLNYNITIRIKVRNDDHDCALKSMLGQDFCLFYRIDGKDGDWQFRRIKGKLVTGTGGILAGYDLTLNALDPSEVDSPLFVNITDAATTLAALDLITDF